MLPFLGRCAGRLADAEAGRFILWLPVVMAGGICAYFGGIVEPQAGPAPIIAAIGFALAWRMRRHPYPRAACLIVACAALGFASAQFRAEHMPPWQPVPRHAVTLSGRVQSVDLLAGGGRRVTVTRAIADGTAWQRAIRLRLRDSDPAGLTPGDAISVRALLMPPAPPAYPGGFDAQRSAWFSGRGASGFALGAVTITATGADGFRWQAVRSAIAARIRSVLPGSSGAIATAMLTGQAQGIPQADRDAFAASGLAHLLAVAGLHAAVVIGLVHAAVRRSLTFGEHTALHWPVRTIASIAGLAAGLIYCLLTGTHVPTQRSLVMIAAGTLAILTGRRVVALRALAAAAAAIMLAAPEEVTAPGFQMSMAAVAALGAGWEAWGGRLASWRRAGGRWRGVAAHLAGIGLASALAGAATLPIAAFHFGSAALYTVPANLIAVPLTAFWIMPLGLAGLALMPLGLDSAALTPMGWGIDVVLHLARMVSALPGASLPVPALPDLFLVLALAGLVWLCVFRSRLRWAGCAMAGAGLAAALLVRPPDLLVLPDGKLAALHLGRIYQMAAKGVSPFERAIPARLWGSRLASMPILPGPIRLGPLACDGGTCRLGPAGQEIVLLGPGIPCPRESALVIALDRQAPGCGGRQLGGRFGGGAVWLAGPAIVIETDMQARGDRPWVFPRQDGVPSSLPAAVAE